MNARSQHLDRRSRGSRQARRNSSRTVHHSKKSGLAPSALLCCEVLLCSLCLIWAHYAASKEIRLVDLQMERDDQPWPWIEPKNWDQEEHPGERPVATFDPADNMTEGTILVEEDQVVIKCNLTRGSQTPEQAAAAAAAAANSSAGSQPDSATSSQAKKTKRAISEEERNELTIRARDIRCQSHSPAKLTLRPPDRSPNRKRLNQLLPGESIDKLLFNGQEPRWMDECNKRPPKNETLRRLWLPSKRSRSVEEVRGRHLKYGTYLRGLHTKENDDVLERRKRAINVDSDHRQLYKLQGKENAVVIRLDAKGGSKQAHDRWTSKKTSFAFAKAKGASLYQYGKKHREKARFFVSDQTNELVAPVVAKAQYPATSHEVTKPHNATTIQEVTEDLFQLDVLLNWHLKQAHKTVEDLKRRIQRALEVIPLDENYERAEDVSEQRRNQILDQRKWMPKFEELVSSEPINRASLYNVTSGLYHSETREFMFNMSQYIQLFAVAAEQMMYDRRFFYTDPTKNNAEYYRAIEEDAHLMLCEAKNVIDLLMHWQRSKEEYMRLIGKQTPDVQRMKDFYEKFTDNKLARDRPVSGDFQPFESPLEREWRQLSKDKQDEKLRQLELLLPENMVKRDKKYYSTPPEQRPQPVIVRHLTHPTHFWRDVMPLEQRQLYTAKERAIRDTSILEDMQLFLASYGSMILNNSP